jgi:hypothetical protein
MPQRRIRQFCFFVPAWAVFSALACDGEAFPSAYPCGAIPAGGCPATRAESANAVCKDAVCRSVYVCSNRQWSLAVTCPQVDASKSPDAMSPDAMSPDMSPDGATDSGVGLRDATVFDAGPPESGNCVDLQSPDCSLSLALSCMGSNSCCGCEDIFRCETGNWKPWGLCENGMLTPASQRSPFRRPTSLVGAGWSSQGGRASAGNVPTPGRE